MRARDLVYLEKWAIDLEAFVVWCERKTTLIKKVRTGWFQERPILNDEAVVLLRSLVKHAHKPEDRLLPNISLKRITTLVQTAVICDHWRPELLWTGAHNLRHGAAAKVHGDLMSGVRASGGWDGLASAMGYARLARVTPSEAGPAQARWKMMRNVRRAREQQ